MSSADAMKRATARFHKSVIRKTRHDLSTQDTRKQSKDGRAADAERAARTQDCGGDHAKEKHARRGEG